MSNRYIFFLPVFLIALILAACDGDTSSKVNNSQSSDVNENDEVGITPVVPLTPTDLFVTAGDGQASMTWSAVYGANEYAIYQNGASLVTGRVSVTETSYTVTGLVNGTEYSFRIAAINGAGSSALSDEVRMTPVAAQVAPSTPTDLSATIADSQVSLTWNPVDGADAYTIDQNGNSIVTVVETSYTVTGLANGTEYGFQVTAINNAGSSALSDEVRITPVAAQVAPSTPTDLSVTAGDSQASLSWSAVDGANEYKIYQNDLLLTTVVQTSHTVTGLANGTAYGFQIAAINNVGSSALSDEVRITPVAAQVAPSTPTDLSVTAGDSQASLSWSAVDGADEYKIYQNGIVLTTILQTSHTVTGLANGTAYGFQIAAINNVGSSALSDEFRITPVAAQVAPSTPTDLSVTAGDSQASLSWSAVDGADEYKIYQGGKSIITVVETSHTVTGLVNGVEYSFQIRASNTSGDSALSGAVTVTLQLIPQVKDLLPKQAILHQLTDFTITGTNLPNTLVLHIPYCDGMTQQSGSSTKAIYRCTPSVYGEGADTVGLGAQNYVIKDRIGGTTLTTGVIIVTAEPETATPDVQIASIRPTTAKINQRTTFTIIGTNLSSELAFYIRYCEDMRQESVSGTTVTYSCIPSVYSEGTDTVGLGAQNYVIKDRIGGTTRKTGFITVTAEPETATPDVQIESIRPTTAKINQRTTFTIIGTNLSSELAFYIRYCEDMRQESASVTTVTYSCIPSVYSKDADTVGLGAQNYVIKDRIGGKTRKTGVITVSASATDQLPTQVTSVEPTEATLNALTDFSIKGINLPSTLDFHIPYCQNMIQTGYASSLVTFSCTPISDTTNDGIVGLGDQGYTVKTTAGGDDSTILDSGLITVLAQEVGSHSRQIDRLVYQTAPQTAVPIDPTDFNVRSIAYSPNGATLAVSSGKNINILKASTETYIRTLTGHDNLVLSVAYSPDGMTIASGSEDNTIRLWNAETGDHIHTLTRHSNSVLSVTFSADSSTIASGSAGEFICLWNVKTGQRIDALVGRGGWVRSIAFSPNGKTMVSGSDDNNIRLWDGKTGALLLTLSGHTGFVYSVAFSPDSLTIASGSLDNTIRLWNAETGGYIRTLTGHTNFVRSVAYSPNGETLASASDDNTIGLWNTKTWVRSHILTGHNSLIHSIAYSPDGKTIAGGGVDGTVHLWDAETKEYLRARTGHAGFVRSVAYSPNGETIISGSEDDTIRLWDAKTGSHIRALIGHAGFVRSVAYDPDGTTIASGSEDETIRLWDAKTGAHIRTLLGHGDFVRSVAYSPDGTTLASGGDDDNIRIWNAKTGAVISILNGHSSYVNTLAYSPDGTALASGSYDDTVYQWDIPTKQLSVLVEHDDVVRSVVYSPDGTTLASGSDDGTIRLSNTETKASIHTLTGHNNLVYSVAYSPDGKTLASGGGDGTIRLWDTVTGTPIRTLTGHDKWVYSVAYSPDGKTIVSGSADKTIGIWGTLKTNQMPAEITNVLPKDATINALTKFTVVGTNLPSSLAFYIPYCENMIQTDHTSTRVTFSCTPKSYSNDQGQAFGVGRQTYQVKYGPGDITLNTGTITVSAATTTAQVTQVSPLEATLGEVTEFTITGTNLPSTLAFFIPYCEGMTRTSISSNKASYSCTPKAYEKKSVTVGIGDQTYLVQDVAGGTTLHSDTITVSAITAVVAEVTQVSPLEATLDEVTEFTITGTNLPSTLAFFIPYCAGMRQTSISSDRASYSCTPRAYDIDLGTVGIGDQTYLVQDAPGGTTLHSDAITVSAATAVIAEVTQVSPVEATLGEVTEFTITGTNLPPTLAFFIPYCAGMRQTSISRDSASYSCTPRVYTTSLGTVGIGKQTYLVKNAPGGTTLLRGDIDVTAPTLNVQVTNKPPEATLPPLNTSEVERVASNEVRTSFTAEVLIIGIGSYTALAHHPSQNRFVTGTGAGLLLVYSYDEAGNITQVKQIKAHTKIITSVAYSSDGHSIASGSLDNTVRIWDFSTGEYIRSLNGHVGSIHQVRYSPDGNTIATAASDKTLRIWNASTGEHIRTINDIHVDSISFKHDGRAIATASGQFNTEIRIWDILTGSEISTLVGHNGLGVDAISYSPVSNSIVSGDDDFIGVWDTSTGDLIHTLKGHTGHITSIVHNPEGNTVVASTQNTARIWNQSTGALIQTLSGYESSIVSMTFTLDGTNVISMSNNRLEIRNIDTGALISSVNPDLSGHTAGVTAVAYSPDGTSIASTGYDKTVRLWDAATGEQQQRITGHTEDVFSVAYSPDGTAIASGGNDNTVRISNAVTGAHIRTLTGHTDGITALAYSPDGTAIASGSDDNTARISNVITGAHIRTLIGHADGIASLAYSPDGATIASGSYDDTLRIWNAATGVLLHTLADDFIGGVNSVVYSQDGRLIASGSGRANIYIWNAYSGEFTRTETENTALQVLSVALSPDGSFVAGGSGNRFGDDRKMSIDIWNVASGQLMHTLFGHTQAIVSIAYSPDGSRIVSASHDGSIRVWDTSQFEPIGAGR